MPWPVALLPYSYSGYLMMSGQADQNPSDKKMAFCVILYVVGIVLMMGSDGQKYF